MSLVNRQSLKLGFISQLTSRVGVIAISVVSTAILARLLLPSEFGILSVAIAVVALAESIFDGAFAINIVHRESLDQEYVATTFNISILFGALLSFCLFASADLWETVIGFPSLGIVLRFLSITLIMKAAGMVSRNLLVREHRLHALSISAVIGAFAGSIVVSCGLAALGAGIWSLVWGTFASVGIETAANIWQARPHLSLRISKDSAYEVLRTGSLYTLSQVLNWGMSSGSSMVSARALGPVDFGFYSRGNKLLELTTSAIGQPLMRVFFPSFARMRNNPLGAEQLLVQAVSLSAFPFALAGALLAVHSTLIVDIVLGSKWQSTASAGQILFLSLLPRCSYKITESAAFGLGAAGLAVKRQAVFAAVALVSVFIGSSWGITGVATAVAISIWINYLVSLSIAARLVGASTLKLCLVHLPPIGLACVSGAVDLFVVTSLQPSGALIAQMAGAFVGLVVAVCLLIIAPNNLVPAEIDSVRRRLRGKRFFHL